VYSEYTQWVRSDPWPPTKSAKGVKVYTLSGSLESGCQGDHLYRAGNAGSSTANRAFPLANLPKMHLLGRLQGVMPSLDAIPHRSRHDGDDGGAGGGELTERGGETHKSTLIPQKVAPKLALPAPFPLSSQPSSRFIVYRYTQRSICNKTSARDEKTPDFGYLSPLSLTFPLLHAKCPLKVLRLTC